MKIFTLTLLLGLSGFASVQAESVDGVGTSPFGSDTANGIEPVPTPREGVVAGTVESINTIKKTIQVRDKQGTTTELITDAETTILGNEQTSTIEDIKVGEEVVLHFDPISRKVERIQLVPSAY
jgi:hypothetical protein